MSRSSAQSTRVHALALAVAIVAVACSESSEPEDSNATTGGSAGSSAGTNDGAGTTSGGTGADTTGGASSGTAGTPTSGAGGGNGGSPSNGGASGAALGGGAGEAGESTAGNGALSGSGNGGGGGDSGSAGSSGSAGASGTTNDAVASPGCGTENAASGTFSIDVDGTEREYILKLPDAYDPEHPYPLVFGWHGRMYDAEWVANGEPPLTGPYFGIESEAAGRAIFVAPQALETGWSDQDGRDLAFAMAMVARFEAELCLDRSRIFSTGFSFGAIMTLVLGCAEGDVFRAIAPMSGSLSNGCPAADRPVAYWSSHGTDDTTVTPAQGEAARDEFLARNHCEATSTVTTPEGCLSYDGCDPGYPVTFCTFEGAHVPAPFAGTAIWSFFSQL
jgi:polyhydroxybutyrate depolymerase